MRNKIFIPYDVFERHKFVANFIREEETVLDVGGGVNALSKFIKSKITVANLKYGDIVADGRNLPFNKNSFDVVTSIDVVEHISTQDRSRFINELLRVARKRVIISAPFGSKKHIEAEKKLTKFLKKKGKVVKYLKEHINNGLPTPKELKVHIRNNWSVRIFYSGDFRLNIFLTKLDFWQLKNPKLNKLFYFVKKIINMSLNLFYFPLAISKKEKPFTNRFYLLITKE